MTDLKKETATDDIAYIRTDRMRYEKNKISSNLALLSIVLNALFFISIYKSNVGQWYYTILIGISIVYNLLFMMFVFLIAEGSKNYMINYSYLAVVIGILQFCRILVYPRIAHSATITSADQTIQVMGDAQFIRQIVYLVISGICLLVSALIGIRKCRELSSHLKALSEKEKKAA